MWQWVSATGGLMLSAVAGVACDGGKTSRGSSTAGSATSANAEESSTAAPSGPSASGSSGSTADPQATAAPTAAPASSSVAALREAAARDPTAFEKKAVSLNGTFVRRIQGQTGTGEHPRHYFAIVEFALVPGEEDALRCIMSGRIWPPPGLEPGDAIAVSGRWSFDRILAGGFAPGGGPLHIAGCNVARAPER